MKRPSIGKEYFNHMNLEEIVTNYPYRKNLAKEDMVKGLLYASKYLILNTPKQFCLMHLMKLLMAVVWYQICGRKSDTISFG